MSEWIKCSDRYPLELSETVVFEVVDVLVTDGVLVRVCDFQRGGASQLRPWRAWGKYGILDETGITHWMPLPEPPTE